MTELEKTHLVIFFCFKNIFSLDGGSLLRSPTLKKNKTCELKPSGASRVAETFKAVVPAINGCLMSMNFLGQVAWAQQMSAPRSHHQCWAEIERVMDTSS